MNIISGACFGVARPVRVSQKILSVLRCGIWVGVSVLADLSDGHHEGFEATAPGSGQEVPELLLVGNNELLVKLVDLVPVVLLVSARAGRAMRRESYFPCHAQ